MRYDMLDKLEDRSMRAHFMGILNSLGYDFFFSMVHNVIVDNYAIFLETVGG